MGIECLDPEVRREAWLGNGDLRVVNTDTSIEAVVQAGLPVKVHGLKRAGTEDRALENGGRSTASCPCSPGSYPHCSSLPIPWATSSLTRFLLANHLICWCPLLIPATLHCDLPCDSFCSAVDETSAFFLLCAHCRASYTAGPHTQQTLSPGQ